MYDVASRSDAGPVASTACPFGRLQRADGEIRLAFAAAGGGVRDAYQQGSAKVRFPRNYEADGMIEAVLLNTAGGVTGGDRFRISAKAGERSAAVLTTQAAEKAYRSTGGEARIDVTLVAASGARLGWLPQETILFDGARLARTLTLSCDGCAEALLCEAVVLGRTASGERVRQGRLTDRWRIRRGDRLVYADDLRIDGAAWEHLAGPATLAGGRAFASLLLVAGDAGSRLDRARSALDGAGVRAGASAWDGLLSARVVAGDGAGLRQALCRLFAATGWAAPRSWMI